MPSSEDSKTATASIESGRKKPYATPKLTSIKLRPEEAVLDTGCKASANGTGMLGVCRMCSLDWKPS
jgi:hypothetical protein